MSSDVRDLLKASSCYAAFLIGWSLGGDLAVTWGEVVPTQLHSIRYHHCFHYITLQSKLAELSPQESIAIWFFHNTRCSGESQRILTLPNPFCLDVMCPAFRYLTAFQSYLRECCYSLFYECEKCARIISPDDIYEGTAKMALLSHFSGEEQDQGPCVTVLRSESWSGPSAHAQCWRQKASW